MNKPELLAPAGDFEKLKVAFHFGADAVYIGMKSFSLRANTKNFTEEELKIAIDYTHKLNKKIYIALNIYFTPFQADGIIKSLKLIEKIKPDGIILSDMGCLYLAKEYAKDIPIHISTQANTTNQYSTKFYQEIGVKRVIVARELSLKEIKNISQNTDVELEAFVHGAMCISYSGRCLLSSYMTTKDLGRRENDNTTETRSANKGDCVHPCRWEFVLKEKTRGEQNYLIEEDENGSYILSSKDICMIYHISDLIDAGISSFKIEGRMKSILYISSIVRSYRRAIDSYFDNSLIFDRDEIEKELNIVSHRDFSTGFFYNSPKINANLTDTIDYKRESRLAALVEDVKEERTVLKIYNSITKKSLLEYIAPDMKTVKIGKIKFFDKNNLEVEKVNHSSYTEAIIYDINNNPIKPDKLDIIRMESNF